MDIMDEIIAFLNTPLFIIGGTGIGLGTIIGIILRMVLPNTKSNKQNAKIIALQDIKIAKLEHQVKALESNDKYNNDRINYMAQNSTNKKIKDTNNVIQVEVIKETPIEVASTKKVKAKKVKVKKVK